MEGLGEIYELEGPNNKRYIGQCKFWIGKKVRCKHGMDKRWEQHVRGAIHPNSKTYNTLLSRAIQKYGADAFTRRSLIICRIDQLDYYEVKYIRQRNTFAPEGYNMTTGGNLQNFCRETRAKIGAKKTGALHHMFGKSWDEVSKEKMRASKLGHHYNPAYRHLPNHVLHYTNARKEGYYIFNHPKLKNKYFLSMKKTMNEKLEAAIEYLSTCHL